MPGLVARSADGEVETVRYQDLPVLLLNELQKSVRELKAAVQRIETLEGNERSLRGTVLSGTWKARTAGVAGTSVL